MGQVIRASILPVRMPLVTPISTSFGSMVNRPGLFVKLQDEDGVIGWGEAWVNFPSWAIAERTMVLHYLLGEVVGRSSESPQAVIETLERYQKQVVQSAGLGPFYHALSAISAALWDLKAHKTGVPLRYLLANENSSSASIPVYASGVGPENVTTRVEKALSLGFRQAKIKVGFHTTQDHENFLIAEQIMGPGQVFVDANQAWTEEQAHREIAFYYNQGSPWVEEPVMALNFPVYEKLSRRFHCIAGGENWYREHCENITAVPLSLFQPDLSKIGGIEIAQQLIGRLAPMINHWALHVLGSPLVHGLALEFAAAHKDHIQLVEWDTNDNPLAAAFIVNWSIRDGQAVLSNAPGSGVTVDEERLGRYVVEALRPWCTILKEDSSFCERRTPL